MTPPSTINHQRSTTFIVRLNNGLAVKFHPPTMRLIYEVVADIEATRFDDEADAICCAINYGLRIHTFHVEQQAEPASTQPSTVH